MWNRLAYLGGLLISVWLLMLLASYGISILVMAPPGISDTLSGASLGIYRVVVGVGIFLLWLWVWRSLTVKYFKVFSRRRGSV